MGTLESRGLEIYPEAANSGDRRAPERPRALRAQPRIAEAETAHGRPAGYVAKTSGAKRQEPLPSVADARNVWSRASDRPAGSKTEASTMTLLKVLATARGCKGRIRLVAYLSIRRLSVSSPKRCCVSRIRMTRVCTPGGSSGGVESVILLASA
jgi:hypothetical protein